MRTPRLSIPLTVLAWLTSAGFLAMVGAVVSPGALSPLSVAVPALAMVLDESGIGAGQMQADILPTLLRARGLDQTARQRGIGFDGTALQDGATRDWGVVVHAGASAPPHQARALWVVDNWTQEEITDVFRSALRTLFGNGRQVRPRCVRRRGP